MIASSAAIGFMGNRLMRTISGGGGGVRTARSAPSAPAALPPFAPRRVDAPLLNQPAAPFLDLLFQFLHDAVDGGEHVAAAVRPPQHQTVAPTDTLRHLGAAGGALPLHLQHNLGLAELIEVPAEFAQLALGVALQRVANFQTSALNDDVKGLCPTCHGLLGKEKLRSGRTKPLGPTFRGQASTSAPQILPPPVALKVRSTRGRGRRSRRRGGRSGRSSRRG